MIIRPKRKPAGAGFLFFLWNGLLPYFPMLAGMAAMSFLICWAVGLVESNCRYLVQISRALAGCFRSTMYTTPRL